MISAISFAIMKPQILLAGDFMKTKARKLRVGRLILLIALIAGSVYFFTHRPVLYQRFGGIISGGHNRLILARNILPRISALQSM